MNAVYENILIRKANLDDVQAMTLLLEQLFSIEADFEFDPEKHKKGFQLLLNSNSNSYVLVAEHKKKIIGLCTMQTLISTAQGSGVGLIEDLIIDKKFRCKGIGTKIMDVMVDIAKKQSLTRLQLLADKNNSGALEFYRKINWVSTNLTCLRMRL